MSIIRYGKDIPNFVRTLRRDLKLTQVELGKQMGVDGQYVSNVERGVQRGSLVGFVALLMSVCPQDRRRYLEDLLYDAAAMHAVRRVDAKCKARGRAQKRK